MFEIIFLKMLLQILLFLLKIVPKRYTNILYTVKNLVKMIFKPPSPKKLTFSYRPNPKKFQICNGDIYEIWLTLLCETMTYFNIVWYWPNSVWEFWDTYFKAILYYLTTTSIAVCLGIILCHVVIRPGMKYSMISK